MTDRERLLDILNKPIFPHELVDPLEAVADYLLDNGVTFAKDIGVPSKWIPVTERLPEHDLPSDTKRRMIRCLVYTNKGTVKPCVRQRWENFAGKMQPWMWNKDEFARPTHWMPLPEPPKED